MSADAQPGEKFSARRAARALVSMYAPGATESELALRARIHVAHLIAAKRREQTDSPEVARIYATASNISCIWTLHHGLQQEDLSEIIKLLTWLFLAAGALERLERNSVE